LGLHHPDLQRAIDRGFSLGLRSVMAQRRGEIIAKTNERDFPHFVDIRVPAGGLGSRLNTMHTWCHARGLFSRHGLGGLFVSRWCFAQAEEADAFAAAFGGSRLDNRRERR
jgi:hypothetical protein